MNIHVFQHIHTEGPGEIETWARQKGHTLSYTRFDLGEQPPDPASFDWLVVMGGPMNIYEHRNFPWLVEEKRALRSAIDKNKPVIGICLGSQLIADVLGGKIYQNPEMEIGWFPVRLHKEAASIAPFARFPEVLTPLHWHGDTFSLPDGAVPIAESVGCKNQAFAVGDRIIGLQFHLEVGMKDVAAFVDAEPSLGSGRFIQTPATILELGSQYLSTANSALFSMLTALEGVRL